MTDKFTAELGRQQFLELFVSQVQYQDPLEPVGQEQFLQQLAQFSTVEGLESLNRSIEGLSRQQSFSAATNLLDQTVLDSLGSEGVVSEVQQVDGDVIVRVGGQLIPLESIQSVKSAGG